jgi:uncharacterized protein
MPGANDPIVVNTSPLIALEACGQMDLLRALHARVSVPQAVQEEFEQGRPDASLGRVAVKLPNWIEVMPLRNPISRLLLAHLDVGEAAVISLALELGVARVIIDERRGRMIAQTLGLTVTGTMGILLRAKKLGALQAIKPCFDAMQSYGIWISDRLIASALREAGEE